MAASDGRGVVLVVNGDDFGYSDAINAAIVRCHREGVLTSATLLVNYPAAGAARALAREHPALGVGLHLNLTGGAPVLPPAEVPSLVDRRGRFLPFPAQLRRIGGGRARLAEVERELRAQFEQMLGWGLRPTHVDGHLHVHAYPRVLPIVLRLMAEYGVRALRSPFLADWLPLHFAAQRTLGAAARSRPTRPAGRRDRLWAVVALFERSQALLTPLGARLWPAPAHRPAPRRGRRALLFDGSEVVLADFLLDAARFRATPDPVATLRAALAPLRAGSVELMAHPAWSRDGALGSAEVAFLTDPRLRPALDDLGVTLAHYGDLTARTPSGPRPR